MLPSSVIHLSVKTIVEGEGGPPIRDRISVGDVATVTKKVRFHDGLGGCQKCAVTRM